MIDQIELAVGTRFKATIGGEFVSGVVEEGTSCECCAFAECERLCAATVCGRDDRTDRISVIFKKDDNN